MCKHLQGLLNRYFSKTLIERFLDGFHKDLHYMTTNVGFVLWHDHNQKQFQPEIKSFTRNRASFVLRHAVTLYYTSAPSRNSDFTREE